MKSAHGVRQGQPWVLDAWEATTPCGVALGRGLHRSGELRALCNAGAPAATVMDTLAARLSMDP